MADFQVTGVVDPARYSDRAVAVIEVPAATFAAMSAGEIEEAHEDIQRQLGMRVLILSGARLARIEEPTDGPDG